MDVTPIVSAGRQMIEAYRTGHFRISGIDYANSVIVTPERIYPWDPAGADRLSLEDFATVIAAEPPVDVLLIGCGVRTMPLAHGIRQGLREAGIGADAMDTGAACRTYNVLVSENRRVAAALMVL